MRKLTAMVVAFALLGTSLIAGEFNWRQSEGTKLKALLVQHTYTDGILRKIDDFTARTGIEVEIAIIPEDNYGDKLTTYLTSRVGEPDIYMAGPYNVWEYGPGDFMTNMDELLADPAITDPDFDINDFFPGILDTLRWDLVPGHKAGTGPLWGMPIGYETECISYNKDVFAKMGVKPVETAEELYALAKKLNKFDGEGTFGITVRGTRNMNTVNTGFITMYANYGATDIAVEGNKLIPQFNTPEAIRMMDDYAKMVRESCSPSWASYSWYQCQADLGARKAAMLFDSSILGYFNNVPGTSAEAGNLAVFPAVRPADSTKPLVANIWSWGLSINPDSKKRTAAWLFVQYFAGKEFLLDSVVNFKSVDTPRKSVFENPEFKKRMEEMDGYVEMLEKTLPGAGILMTPTPYHFEITTEWAATLQDLVAGVFPNGEAAMNDLQKKVARLLDNIDLNDYEE